MAALHCSLSHSHSPSCRRSNHVTSKKKTEESITVPVTSNALEEVITLPVMVNSIEGTINNHVTGKPQYNRRNRVTGNVKFNRRSNRVTGNVKLSSRSNHVTINDPLFQVRLKRIYGIRRAYSSYVFFGCCFDEKRHALFIREQ